MLISKGLIEHFSARILPEEIDRSRCLGHMRHHTAYIIELLVGRKTKR